MVIAHCTYIMFVLYTICSVKLLIQIIEIKISQTFNARIYHNTRTNIMIF